MKSIMEQVCERIISSYQNRGCAREIVCAVNQAGRINIERKGTLWVWHRRAARRTFEADVFDIQKDGYATQPIEQIITHLPSHCEDVGLIARTILRYSFETRMLCPNCLDPDSIDIDVRSTARLFQSGEDISTDINGDHEWTDDNGASCARCGWCGDVRDLQDIPKQNPPVPALAVQTKVYPIDGVLKLLPLCAHLATIGEWFAVKPLSADKFEVTVKQELALSELPGTLPGVPPLPIRSTYESDRRQS